MAASLVQRSVSFEVDDIPVHIQIIKLQQQVYVWVGTGTPKMQNLHAAMPTKLSTTPAVASLIPGTADSTMEGMAQRLVLKTGVPVALSVNLPAEAESMRRSAERRILEELQSMKAEAAAAEADESSISKLTLT